MLSINLKSAGMALVGRAYSPDPARRPERVRPMLQPKFYSRRHQLSTAIDPVQHYLEHGRAGRLDPSALFDTSYYVAQLGWRGLPARLTAAEHYLDRGVELGLDPSSLFRTRYYLASNPDVAAAGVNPLVHFMESGAKEGRRPVPPDEMELDQWLAELRKREQESEYAATFATLFELQARAVRLAPIFDTEYYRARGGIATDLDPIRHYLEVGGAAGLDPSPFFDTAFYLAQLEPETLAAGTTPLEHYLTLGSDAGHDPSALFATKFYLAENPDVARAGLNPLLHFVQSGAQEGRPPVPFERLSPALWADRLLARDPRNAYGRHLRSMLRLQPRALRITALIDADFYRRCYALDRNVDVVRHYLEEGGAAGLDPSPLFDTAFYLSQLGPEVLGAEMTPLEHYLTSGADAGHDPSPLFVTRFYLAENRDVAAAGMNPLLHFVESGASEGRIGVPLSLPNLEERIARAIRTAGPNPPVLGLVVNLRLRQGRLGEALALVKNATDTAGPTVHLLEGRVLQALGRLPEAITAYEKVATDEASGDQIDDIVAERLVQGAYALEVAENLELAIESYEAATARRREDPLLRDHVDMLKRMNVEALYSRGDRDGAVSLARTTMWAETGNIVERRLESVREHCDRVGDPYREIRPHRQIRPPDLLFLGPRPSLTAERGSLEANPIYTATLSDCTAFSRCNVLMTGDAAVYDLARQPRAAEAVLNDRVNGIPLIRARADDRLMLELPRLPTVAVERGLSMFGVQSGNYGHWFVEFLPKMLVFDRDAPADVPIYIDRGMPPTHLESLQILNSSNRPIRYMPEDSIVHFGQLGVAPVPAYFPLDLKRNASYDTVWPADVFSDLRSVLMRRVEQSEEVSLRSKRPLFISRKGFASRQLLNEAEISDFLASFGFETIYPEQLTFAEQVNVFRSASIVVGSCSSALTNCLFCDPDCPVIGLIHDEPSFNFNGYSSFLLSGGVRIIFVRGKSLKEVGTHPLHSRYIVAPDRVLEAMRMSGWDGQILGKSSVGGSGTSDRSAALAASAPLQSTAFNQSGLAPS